MMDVTSLKEVLLHAIRQRYSAASKLRLSRILVILQGHSTANSASCETKSDLVETSHTWLNTCPNYIKGCNWRLYATTDWL